ncbi:hypothetical protein R80B4_02017 [Fibrobacteres bacterium R8-0-B4]
MVTNIKYIFVLLILCQLCAAETNQDKVFVVRKKVPDYGPDAYCDSKIVDILYYRTNGTLRKIYTFGTEDASELEYGFHYSNDTLDYDCLYWYNNSSDCTHHIFLDRKTKVFYFTRHCTDMFRLDKRSVNFKNGTVVLRSYTYDYDNQKIIRGKNTKIIDKTKSRDSTVLYGEKIQEKVLVKLLLLTKNSNF